MTKLRDDKTLRRLAELDREERVLVVRALRGDRAAFDSLFDRYFDRMVHCFRDLPEGEAQGRVADALAHRGLASFHHAVRADSVADGVEVAADLGALFSELSS